ncbi:MAG TPA: Hsp70 family protein [Thermodesulfobacteriaceae bacterium]|nr:Hsp70 family protein [Thermodesulfobacteriaceae bacterium]
MSDSRYIIGIDLGTTNCVLSYVDTEEDKEIIRILPVPQIVAPGETDESDLLPSFIYLPTEQEKKDKTLTLPWDPFGDRVVGAYARARGAEVPGRLVVSAKSWLCHQGVDRTAPLLPVDAPEDVPRLSPIVASATYLRHLKSAWNFIMAKTEEQRLENQEIYITIPASFDAVARELTVKAAASAGLENIVLLEEPQAAFYAWLNEHRQDWKDLVQPGDLLLVCDVGGGTTDLSLIKVTSEEGELALKRIAVGNHILLGGDNMDLALAYNLGEELRSRKIHLNSKQMQTLWHNVRIAKERLLSDSELSEVPVVIPGTGSGLVGGTIRTGLTRENLESILLEGFLPRCRADELPEERPRIGLQELGLPYVNDTAITKHLAGFLNLHSVNEFDSEEPDLPTGILFNGGVFKSDLIRRRIADTLGSWLRDKGSQELLELASADLDRAVALGAAYFGLVRRGDGLRIRGGIAQSYYIGIEGSRPAVPGIPPAINALCIVPQGLEEGESVSLPERQFGLVVGQPVEFRFMASTIRPDDQAGDYIDDWEGTIEPVTTLQTSMEAPDVNPGTVIPVEIEATVTEVGTLALFLVSRDKGLRFKLEFNVRS